MALNRRKGFVYTLEAILASALVLGVVLSVIPKFQQDAKPQPEQQVRSGLKTLEKTGDLTDNLSSREIETEIEPYVPNGYNHSVSVLKVESVSDSVSAPYQRKIDTSGTYSELQLWVDSANDLNVSFDGKTVLEKYSGKNYNAFSVSSQTGWLNFTGSGELEYSFNTYSSDREDIDQDEVSVTNYIVLKNGAKEVQVRLWKE